MLKTKEIEATMMVVKDNDATLAVVVSNEEMLMTGYALTGNTKIEYFLEDVTERQILATSAKGAYMKMPFITDRLITKLLTTEKLEMYVKVKVKETMTSGWSPSFCNPDNSDCEIEASPSGMFYPEYDEEYNAIIEL